MKKPYYIVGLAIVLFAIVLVWTGVGTTPRALAVKEGGRAGEDHAAEGCCPHQKEERKSLFDKDDHGKHANAGHSDEHAGQDHAPKPPAHDGHDHGPVGGICLEHNVAEADCALCQGGHIGDLQPGEGMKVRLAELDVAAKAGVHLALPQKVSLSEGVDIPGQVAFDRNKLAYITPLAPGVIRQVHVQPGAKVNRGDVLAEIAMPEVATLKAQLASSRARQAQSEATYLREKDLLERGISSRQEFQQAESEYRAIQSSTEQYRQQLLNFGLSASEIEQLSQGNYGGANVLLRAPFAGVVTDVQTAVGEAVSAGTALFTLADLDLLWIELAIPESRIYLARVGATIQARFDGLPETIFSGRLFQVGATVDQRTRTLKALARVENPEQRLKVGMFGAVRILAGEVTEGLVLPADAIQNIDGLPFVFIQEEPDLFELRRVATGLSQDGLVAVATGLRADDQVVTSQGFALKSEVLKARLGATCADH